MNKKTTIMNRKTIKVDRESSNEFKYPSLNAKQTLETIAEIIKMNSGRILKVEITLSNNIYRTNTETEIIAIINNQ